MDWLEAINNAISGGGFSMSEGMVNEASRQLEDALKKAQDGVGTVGYQTEPGMDGSAEFSPLFTQSIDHVLADATTFSEEDFVMWDLMPKDKATQTLHEIRSRVTHGDRFLDHSSAEGEAGVNDVSTFAATSVQIKFWTARRELTNVAANMPSQGVLVNGGLLADQTKEAMLMLMRTLEVDCLWGDSSVNDLKTDGLITQIEAAGQYQDLEGSQLSFDRIERKISELSNVDIGAKPTHLFVTNNVWHDLSLQAQDGAGRFVKDGEITGRNFTFGSTGLQVFSHNSKRRIKVEPVPFLDIQKAFGSPFTPDTALTNSPVVVPRASPEGTAPDAIAITSQPTATGDASSKFKTEDAGTYKYYFMGVNEGGHTMPLASSTVAVAAGQIVTTVLTAPTTYFSRYIMVFRTDSTGVSNTAQYLFTVKQGTTTTTIVDKNIDRRGCSRVLLANMADTKELAFYRLLPLARVPLAQIKLKIPFVLFMSGAVKVKVPRKQWIWKNVGVSNPL